MKISRPVQLLFWHILLSLVGPAIDYALVRQAGVIFQLAPRIYSFLIFAFVPAVLFLLTNRFIFSWTIWLTIAGLLAALQAGKYHFLQNPLYLMDFFPATIRTMLGVLPGLSLSVILLSAGLLLVVFAAIVLMFKRAYRYVSPVKIWYRLLMAIIPGILPLLLLFSDQQQYAQTLIKLKMNYSDFSRTFSLARMGFWGSLWHDVRYLTGKKKPDHYSKESVSTLRNAFASKDQNAPQTPSVIILLLESFWDPLDFPELKVQPDPIPFFRSLQRNYQHGKIQVPMYGGGTALTEFEILTGLSTAHIRGFPYVNLVRKIPSLATHLSASRYSSVFIHGYQSWFYARDRAVPLMGFEKFLYNNHIYAHFGNKDIEDSRYITDDYFMQFVMGQLPPEPFLMYASTYATHGPYINEHDKVIYRMSHELDQKIQDELQANFILLKKADEALEKLVRYLTKSGKNILLFAFGDHVPNKSYIHLDLRKYDKEKPFWLPYRLVHTLGKKRPVAKNLHATAVADTILQSAGLKSAPQFGAAAALASEANSPETEKKRSLMVYDLLFGEQILNAR